MVFPFFLDDRDFELIHIFELSGQQLVLFQHILERRFLDKLSDIWMTPTLASTDLWVDDYSRLLNSVFLSSSAVETEEMIA
jgi:hypothetical protein